MPGHHPFRPRRFADGRRVPPSYNRPLFSPPLEQILNPDFPRPRFGEDYNWADIGDILRPRPLTLDQLGARRNNHPGNVDMNVDVEALSLDDPAPAQAPVDESNVAESETGKSELDKTTAEEPKGDNTTIEESKLDNTKTEESKLEKTMADGSKLDNAMNEGSKLDNTKGKGAKLDNSTTEETKLSNAEKKKLAKAQKQAKRQAQKADAPGASAVSIQVPKKGKGKEAVVVVPSSSKLQASSNHSDRGGSVTGSVTQASTQPDENDKRVAMFSHLYPVQRNDTIVGVSKEVHRAVLAFGLQLSSYEITGSNARCIEMLKVLKPVIKAYTTPADNSLPRHFINHALSPQLDYIKSCRPLSIGMGNAIRHLKDAIVKIDPDMEEEDAKQHLYQVIDNFLAERIVAPDALIAKAAAEKIENGDVVLTYAQSSIVKKVFFEAHAQGKSFRVIVVDSKPLYEGKYLAKDLAKAGIAVEYLDIGGVWHSGNRAKKVILGAHAMMGNGALYSRVGTCTVAMLAKEKRIPVMVCCESYKFTEKVYLDAITNNELGPPEELFEKGKDDELAALYKEIPGLQVLNVMYDLTPPDYVNMVVNEYGNIPPSAITAVLRKQENERGNQS